MPHTACKAGFGGGHLYTLYKAKTRLYSSAYQLEWFELSSSALQVQAPPLEPQWATPFPLPI